APEVDGIGELAAAIEASADLMRNCVADRTAGALRPVIFSASYRELYFGLVAPTRAAQIFKRVVVHNSSSTANPYVLVNVRKAVISVGTGLIRERESVVVNLEMTQSLRGSIPAMGVKAPRFRKSIVA